MRFVAVLLLVLFEIGLAVGQPQAPITWGEGRLLPAPWLPCPYYWYVNVFPHGDTLVAYSYFWQLPQDSVFPQLSVSTDNGQSWTPWRRLLNPDSTDWSGDCQIAFVHDAILCNGFGDYAPGVGGTGFWRTTDLGGTWQRPSVLLLQTRMRFHQELRDTLYCNVHGDSVTWTGDEGQTYAPRRYSNLPAGITDLAVSGQRIHAMSIDLDSTRRDRVHYTHGPRLSGDFAPMRVINPDIGWTDRAALTFGEDGTGILLSCDEYEPPAPDYGAIIMNITRDDGDTWTAADTLTGESADSWWVGVYRWGHRWLCCWLDSTRDAGFANGGLRCCFSPNNGQYWYPHQQIEGSGINDFHYVRTTSGELGRSWARLYLTNPYVGDSNYYVQWEGQIHADTVLPQISVGLPLPDEVAPGSVVQFLGTASDNDTVWDMTVMLHRWGSSDSVVVPLSERVSQTDFRGSWTVPPDTAGWFYQYHADDRWENTATYPDTGDFFFHTPGWSSTSSFIPHPSAFTVSVYPNPSNGWPAIRLSPEWFGHGAVTIRVYNVLGECLVQQELAGRGGGMQLISLSENRNLRAASGVYFLRVSNKARAKMVKVAVLK